MSDVRERLVALGLQPRSYSGRGMFGRECVAVYLEQGVHPGDLELPAGWRQDQLGLGTVVYWPSLAWELEQTQGDS